ncbi:MFS transporter [Microbacterium rhizophilus]|uniref:MFS transporter n=1 Tax=Microbacterium rhizophilus TaxID=3138934 RepID=UPI0031EA1064
MGFRESAAILRQRNFGWFFASRFVNMAGSAMSHIALAFALLEVSDSPTALGQVIAAHTIPMVALLLVGGVIADRFPRRVVIQLGNVLSGLVQASLAALVLTGVAEIWMLVVLSTIHGVASAATFPAMQGLVPQLVTPAHLKEANLLLSMSRGALTILGPSVAAALVVGVGGGWALAIDAATWLIAAVLLAGVRIPSREQPAASPSLVRELREGWTMFRRTTWLWVIVAAFFVLNAIHTGAIGVLAPAFAKQTETIGIGGWGLAASAEAVGLLLMTLVLMRMTLRHPLRAGMIGMALMSVPLLMLSVWPERIPLILAMAAAGAGMQVFGLGWNLAMMENIPEKMLSRMSSYDALGSFAAMPVGQLAYGPLAVAFGAANVFGTSAVVYLVVCLAALCVPAVWRLPRVQVEKPAPIP